MDKVRHIILWTPPYLSRFQPIELCWAHTKNYVAAIYVKGAPFSEMRAKVQEGMYGNAGTSRYVLRPHGPPDCAAIAKNAEKYMNAYIKDDDVLGGTVEEGVTGLIDFNIAELDKIMKEETSRKVTADEKWLADLTMLPDEDDDEGDDEGDDDGEVEVLACDEEANLEVDLENKKIGERHITESDKKRLLELVEESYGKAAADALRSGSEDEADVDLMATKQDEQMDSDDEEGGGECIRGRGECIRG